MSDDEYKGEEDLKLINTLVAMWQQDASHFENFIKFLTAIIEKSGELMTEGNYTPLMTFILSGNPEGLAKMSMIRNTSPAVHHSFKLADWNRELKLAMERMGVDVGAKESEELRDEHEQGTAYDAWKNYNACSCSTSCGDDCKCGVH